MYETYLLSLIIEYISDYMTGLNKTIWIQFYNSKSFIQIANTQ